MEKLKLFEVPELLEIVRYLRTQPIYEKATVASTLLRSLDWYDRNHNQVDGGIYDRISEKALSSRDVELILADTVEESLIEVVKRALYGKTEPL